jgi:hypothetical protein
MNVNYKGYDIAISYDADYPEPNNWRVCIYQQITEYPCVWINYFPGRMRGINSAKTWIDGQTDTI